MNVLNSYSLFYITVYCVYVLAFWQVASIDEYNVNDDVMHAVRDVSDVRGFNVVQRFIIAKWNDFEGSLYTVNEYTF